MTAQLFYTVHNTDILYMHVQALQNFSIENCDIHCTRPIIDCLFIDN